VHFLALEWSLALGEVCETPHINAPHTYSGLRSGEFGSHWSFAMKSVQPFFFKI